MLLGAAFEMVKLLFKDILFSSHFHHNVLKLLRAKILLSSLVRNQLKLNLVMLLVSFTHKARVLFAVH